MTKATTRQGVERFSSAKNRIRAEVRRKGELALRKCKDQTELALLIDQAVAGGIQKYEKLKDPVWDDLVLLDDSDPEKRRVETTRGNRVPFSVWDDKQAFEANLRHLRNRFPYIKHSLLRRLLIKQQPVTDVAQLTGADRCAPVELLEQVIATLRESSGSGGLTLEFWAQENGIGRAAFFEWKRSGGQPVKGTLSVRMADKVNHIVGEEARSLGLLETNRTDAPAATATAPPPSLPVLSYKAGLCNADHTGESEQQPDIARTELGLPVETNSD